MKKKLLVTGSCGLIGSECVRFFSPKGFSVIGIDNNMRKEFFGEEASVEWNKKKLLEEVENYRHYDLDIRDSKNIEELFRQNQFDLIIHTAAQPSHDWAANEPYTDFSINAQATLNLLENFRRFSPAAVFIFTSTNKVYGDKPNSLPLIELKKRYELPSGHRFYQGIDESMSIDQSLHSLFGVSKASADLLVQEYGRYFGLKTACFRGGCLSGPAHSGARLHGFLSYLVRCCISGKKYTIYGYRGKQVRDNIHSYDLVNAFYHFYQNPHCGEVYNIGGSRYSNISVLEAIELIEKITEKKLNYDYSEQNRKGDHIWWISDIKKFRSHYPHWNLTYNIPRIIEEIYIKQKEIYKE
ncbi:MAG: NAD-dependent epimerase/dehydratase family protein [Candidatus Omnitrophica bacterium]|nr:NAD-dependent epimerase/dehydratase family protein [Candidatus Omnitrophota bacterium]